MATYLQNTTTLLAAGASVNLGVCESGIAARIVFSAFADQNGTLLVKQSFENPYLYPDSYGNIQLDPSGLLNYANQHWDVQDSVTVTANTPLTSANAQYTAIGSYVLFRFTNTGGSTQTIFRFHARVYGIDRG